MPNGSDDQRLYNTGHKDGEQEGFKAGFNAGVEAVAEIFDQHSTYLRKMAEHGEAAKMERFAREIRTLKREA